MINEEVLAMKLKERGDEIMIEKPMNEEENNGKGRKKGKINILSRRVKKGRESGGNRERKYNSERSDN